jgi:serine/threonine-protein kinase TNNI3K
VEIPQQSTQQSSSTINSSQDLNMNTFARLYNNLQVYRLNINDIEDIKIIDVGGFAIVWLVQYQNDRYLASKRLRTGDLSVLTSSQMDEFTKEIRMVSMLKHANVVEFVGVAWNGNDQHMNLQMLFEYMEGGDLRNCLRRTGESRTERTILPFEWTRKKLEILRDIASALIYVHSFRPPILHRDIKSRNILLSSNAQTSKLSDFGVSRIRSQDTTSMTANIGTIRWLAPEVSIGSRKYNESADVYSFGMLICELDSHDVPFAKVVNQENEPLHEQAVLIRLAMGLLNPIEAIDSIENTTRPERVYTLAKRCLIIDPKERPTAMDIAYEMIVVQYE